uniref:Uncharacterized protein n=1 Tax=Megaselia scalaris TaxID=36166 RepID=T1GKL0_MEGSC
MSFKQFTTAQEFIETDPFEVPELYWPELEVMYSRFSIESFPMVIGSDTPKTGLLVFFASNFQEYYENYRNRHIGKNQGKSKFRGLIIVNPDVSEYTDGYPLKISKECFMKPFEVWVWILLLIFLIYFTISLRIVEAPDLFLCFFESSIQNEIKNKFVYMQLFLYGFIIWNLHSAKLSSYLTTPNLGKTIKSVEDINRANITLWGQYHRNIQRNITEHVKTLYPRIYDLGHKTFKANFNYSIEKDTFYKHIYDFDVTHGYLINEEKWKFISRSQTLLSRKLFSFSKICPTYGYIYPFFIDGSEKVLKEIVSFFTLKVLENGLDLAWEELSILDMKLKFKKDYKNSFQVLGFDVLSKIGDLKNG